MLRISTNSPAGVLEEIGFRTLRLKAFHPAGGFEEITPPTAR